MLRLSRRWRSLKSEVMMILSCLSRRWPDIQMPKRGVIIAYSSSPGVRETLWHFTVLSEVGFVSFDLDLDLINIE